MLLSLKYLISFQCVSGVTQFILITFFARRFVQYSSSSAMSVIHFIMSPYFITPCRIIVGRLRIFFELEFQPLLSSFDSFVNKKYRLRVSIFVSGCCVVSCVFSPF